MREGCGGRLAGRRWEHVRRYQFATSREDAKWFAARGAHRALGSWQVAAGEACGRLAQMRSFKRLLAHPVAVSGIVALLVAGPLYGDVIALPLFSDDLVQIPWLEAISWRELWTSPSPYGYYRPLWYTIWRGWGMLTGGLHPRGLHLLNLMSHVIATWLTGLLAATWLHSSARRDERAAAAALASMFFVVFPFSRQAVAWPGAVYNPIVSGMAAAAVLAYVRGRRRQRTWLMAAALVLSALAPLCYESGMLVAPLLVMTELIGRLRRRWEARSWWWFVMVAVFPISLAVWQSMRGVGVTRFGLTPVDLWRNTALLSQGLI
ncbi:MAG: hypothetical protein PVF54_06890, partial [Anaerolineae bacterium]